MCLRSLACLRISLYQGRELSEIASINMMFKSYYGMDVIDLLSHLIIGMHDNETHMDRIPWPSYSANMPVHICLQFDNHGYGYGRIIMAMAMD